MPINPRVFVPPGGAAPDGGTTGSETPSVAPPENRAPAPAPNLTFEGLDRQNWGAGSPPDTTGDVGPDYFIQAVNTSVGIYRKSDGFREAAFTFDTLMSQGNFGNLCDTNNFGDPVVLYDTFEDRWVLTDFAFVIDGGGNVVGPAYQCFAVSKSGNPLTGGWNFYSIVQTDGLHDYEKLGVWTDGIYMTANMFSFGAGSSFQGVRVWAINKAQMYAGSPTVKIVAFDLGSGDFTVVPSNARLQTGTPPPGTPNYFISTWNYLNAVSVYKFHVNWDKISLSTFTGPDVPLAATSWPNAAVADAPQPGTTRLLDVLQIRAMVQNQYTNLGGAESLWIPHTVRRANTTGFAAPRWYQVNVTGGGVAASLPQAATWDPDGANVTHRFMPSLAVDRAGNMALGYSTSSSSEFPSLKYAGRLAADPVNTFSQTEQTLFAGTASQTGSSRWGDYSAMTLDPDGCTFWYTSEYANPDSQDFDKRWKTKIGSFRYAACVPVGSGGTVSGTVTATPGGSPLQGATVMLGSRTTTTDAGGNYSFTVPAGTYPGMTASFPGRVTATAGSIVIADAGTTTQNFSLAASATSACPTDTTQADFQNGVPTNVSLTASPGDVKLANPPVLDQQNTNLITSGFASTTAWRGQTFTAARTGKLVRVDLNLFSLDCSAVTMPNITVSLRNASGNLPTGADLATATIPGFCDGGGGWFTATFAAPASVTAGTQYALVWRSTLTGSATSGNPRYVSMVSSADPYSGGRRLSSTDGGTTWTGATVTSNNDHGFKTHVEQGYSASGNLVSGVKDSNPPANSAAHWTTLSWTATTPANTTLRFQAAASNSANGPFNFVGPDGTAATFFTTSGASLSQFNGKRYLQYKAFLGTTDGAVTPTLSDVAACFFDLEPSITAASPLSRQQGSAAVNSQIASVGDPGYAANTRTVTATPLTGSGVTVNNIAVDATGKVTADVAAGCAATNSTFTLEVTDGAGATATTTLTVNVTANAAPTLSYGSASVNATEGKGVSPATGPADNGSISSIIVHSAGTYTGGISVDSTTGAVTLSNAAPAGTHAIVIRATDNCGLTTDAGLSLTVNKIGQTITFGALADKTFGDPNFTVSATGGASGNPVSFSSQTPATCSIGGNTVTILAAGACTVRASQEGSDNYTEATDVDRTFQIAKAPAAVAVSSSANPSDLGQPVTFTASVTSGAGTPTGTVAFKGGGTAIAGCESKALSSGQAACTTSALAAGGHAITADYSGDSNFNSSSGALAGGQAVSDGFGFSQAAYTVAERGGSVTVTVRRAGDTSQAASVDYSTDDGSTPAVAVPCSDTTGLALDRCDYTRALGTLRFAAGQTEAAFVVLVNDDSYGEGTETASLRLSNPSAGAALGSRPAATLEIEDDVPETQANPLDDDEKFVRQHYHDFLNREPDARGLQFWTGEIAQCGSDAPCREVKRINVSAAFFLSIEFQQTGYFVYRLDKTAFGDINAPAVPVPSSLGQFLLDTQLTQQNVVVGQGDWEQQLDANKAAFALAFVQRPEFLTRYPASASAASFVASLDSNAGGVLSASERAALVAELAPSPSDAALRASVLRQVADDADTVSRESNRAFVLMQYFGYLRRDPNAAPDTNFDGYQFWLAKLDHFNGNFIHAEMVKAFISSDEYRRRFGQ